MTNSFVRTALVGGLALGISSLAAAAPPPTSPSPRPNPVTDPGAAPATDPTRPSPTPADPTPPTGSMPQLNKARTPAGNGAGTPTAVPTNPSATAGILNEKDIPGQAQALSPKEARAAQKAVQELHKANALEIALGKLAQERATAEPVRAYGKELVESHQAADKKLGDFAANHGFVLTTTAATPAVRDSLPVGTDTPVPERTPGAAMPSGDRAAGPAGTGTGKPGAGSVAGTVTSPATTGTSPPAGSTPGAAAATPPEGAMGGTAVASDANAAGDLDAEGRRTLASLQKLDGDKFDRQFLTTMVKGHTKVLQQIKGFEKQQKNAEIGTLLSDARTMVEHHLDRAKTLQRGGSADATNRRDRTLGAL
jgi:predicted outer membrane protein